MTTNNTLALFQERIRRLWYEDDWWYSVVDVVGVLTDTPTPRVYWGVLKNRLKAEGASEVFTNCKQLKLRSPDGKMRTTDAANTETLLRIVQSIPSPKAEPFKRWLAKVGTERLQEEAQPGVAEQRLVAKYRKKGYADEWITRRLQGIYYRGKVVAEWSSRGAGTGRQIAALTDDLNVGGFGITTGQHKAYKGLGPRDDLRDSETDMELAVNIVGEVTATQLHRQRDTQGFTNLRGDCAEAGKAAEAARKAMEEITGEPVLSKTNYKQLQQERQRELQPGLFDQSED